MKSVPKLIRRFLIILLLGTILLFALNILVLFILASRQTPGASPWTTALEIGAALQKTGKGSEYILPEEVSAELAREHAWGILIDNTTHQVVWHTNDLPAEIPLSYSLAEIASLTRGYLMDYPTFTGGAADGLVVLGYPKNRYWKHMYPNWDYHFIENLPRYMLNTLLVNAIFIFLIYFTANMKLLRSVKPIVEGIQALPAKEPVYVKERGLLSELAASINQTAELLRSQNYQLKKKETARANWIAGISHDIRTPLSMAMGYAGQLSCNPRLTEDEHKQAAVIVRQCERIRSLIGDLNLASKLEYDMQPLHRTKENAVAIVRQTAVDYINMDIDGKYPIEWQTDPKLTACLIDADRDLLKRAVSNLIQNCINHNADGCTIYLSVQADGGRCIIRVEDDGLGISQEQLDKLNGTPHYMMCDSNIRQRHGLGLLIVRQIAASHGGSVRIYQNTNGGFGADILLPLSN